MHKSQVYGFKLHIYQIKFPHFVLARLARDDWKIIHLKRKNHIRRALSDLIAKETKHWHSRKNRPDPTYRVHVPIEKIVKAIETKKKWDVLEADVLKRLPRFEIDYEKDLADASLHQPTIGRVCDYLGLDASPVQTILRKTDPRPFSEILLNYDEIIAFIKNSEFHSFLQHEQIECRQ
jgi:LPS sulfotransferase NodH